MREFYVCHTCGLAIPEGDCATINFHESQHEAHRIGNTKIADHERKQRERMRGSKR